MSTTHDDDDLRSAYRSLEEETRSNRVPDFQAMMAKAREEAGAPDLGVVQGGAARRPRGRRAVWAAGWATTALAAALAGVIFTAGGPSEGDAEFELLVASYSANPAGGAWSSPTSELMDVPGMELVRTMPSLGGMIRGVELGERPDPPGSEGLEI